MRDIGYDSLNLFMNLGTLAFLCCVYLGKVFVVIFILKPVSWKFKAGKKVYKHYKRQVFFGDLFAIFVEGYMEFLISSALMVIVTPKESVDHTNFQIYTAYSCLVLAIVIIPGLYIWIFTRKPRRIASKLFQRRWGMLIQNVNYQQKINLFFPFLFVLQRMLYVFISFFLKEFPAMQIMALNYIGLFAIIYFGNYLPLIGRLVN
jgi:hypothetical protein